MISFVLTVAAGGGSGGSMGPVVYVVIAVIVVGFVSSFLRLRHNGPGPAVRYVPRRWRGSLNSIYRRAGWQEPFDSEGNRNSERSVL